MIKRKNHIVLIEAIAKLNNPKFHLFICGDGIQESELKQKVEELNLQNQIHFLGFRNDIYKLCCAADLFLFASLQEGLPVAVMEAMACGLPIIASRIRGNIDLIDEGKGGYLLEPRDAKGFASTIKFVMNNKEKIKYMKDYNLAKIENYSQEKILKQMKNLYNSII